MKLICFDMDGVIFDCRNFWMNIAEGFGTKKELKDLAAKYLYTNYDKLVEEATKLWKGKDVSLIENEVAKITYLSGVKETIQELKKKGYVLAIITSSERHLAERAQKELKVDYIFYNELVVENGKLTGGFIDQVRVSSKQLILKKLCQKLNLDFKDAIIVGDGKNDIRMAKMAGFAIAFNPDSEELTKYCQVTIRDKDLRLILGPIKKFEEEKKNVFN